MERQPRGGMAFALDTRMSKHNPNQDYYKIQGRDQSDGPDRAIVHDLQKEELTEHNKKVKRNFIPGEAPVGEPGKNSDK